MRYTYQLVGSCDDAQVYVLGDNTGVYVVRDPLLVDGPLIVVRCPTVELAFEAARLTATRLWAGAARKPAPKPSSPLRRELAIDKLLKERAGFVPSTIKARCRELGIPRSTYYDRKRSLVNGNVE